MDRQWKGVTPVVALVLLVLLTISAAGAAFSFVQLIIEDREDAARQLVASSLSIKQITCTASTDTVTVQASNDGDTVLDDMELFGYYVANDTLVFTNTTNSVNWSTDTFAEHNLTVTSGSISADTRYSIELVFDTGYTATSQCTGE